MKKLQYKIDITAPVERVYRTMLGLDDITTYEQWTSAFNPTSTYEGSWSKGSKIHFIGVDSNGKRGGMVAEIADNIPDQMVSIRHYGILDGEQEITTGPEIEKWAGGLENYYFVEYDGVTTVTVDVDVVDEYITDFSKTWPQALDKLKEIAEKQAVTKE